MITVYTFAQLLWYHDNSLEHNCKGNDWKYGNQHFNNYYSGLLYSSISISITFPIYAIGGLRQTKLNIPCYW